MVDYKVLIYEKPLVQIGNTTLKGKGCTYEVGKREDLESQINLALRQGMTKNQKNSFDIHLKQLLTRYLWDDCSDRELRYGLPVEKNIFD